MNDEYAEVAVRQAAVTLQWQAADVSDDGNGYPIDGDGDEHTDRVAEIISDDVTAFVRGNWQVLMTAGVDAGQCGHDLVLTANRHGTGFWDRGLDMPADDPEALIAYKAGRAAYDAWIAQYRDGRYPQTAGDALTAEAHMYSFEAGFRLWGDDADGELHCSDEVALLVVENTVIKDDIGWSS